MRVICGDYAVAIKIAKCVDKRLVFTDFDGVYYHTDDYFAENIAHCALNDLVVNGYLRVKALYIP